MTSDCQKLWSREKCEQDYLLFKLSDGDGLVWDFQSNILPRSEANFEV